MDLTYREQNFNSAEILYNSQLIADTFAESLKQNNCLLMLTVAMHQEINDAITDYKDLDAIGTETENSLNNLEEFDDSILDSIQEAIRDSKDRCFTCKLSMPSLDFDMDLDAILGRLRALLEGYAELFKIGKLDLCQAAYAMRNSCLPDILRLIILLVTAYAAIIMLKSIGSISILAFIKGVISAILDKIFSSLKISVSIGSTNISCIIEALREIANSLVPTEERILAGLEMDMKDALGFTKNAEDGIMTPLANEYISALDDGLNRGQRELARVDKNIEKLEDKINETFGVVVNVMDGAMKEINAYIQNLLAFKLTFECEGKRSGTDITEVIKKVNKLIQVLNLLSAVALSVAKKDARDKICSSPNRIKEMSNEEISLDDIQMKEIVEEYYGKEAEIVSSPENGIQIIIYDKPKEPVLPKIDLLNCSIDDFINSHTIDNLIKTAEDEVRRELDNPRNTGSTVNNKDDVTKIGKGTYVLSKPSPSQLTNIDNIVNILYDDPEEDLDKIIDNILNPSEDEITNIIGTQGVSDLFKENNEQNTSLNCRTIDDVMSVLNQLRR